jgi:glycosyltransferase involved in cell wall biosynthesis
VAIVGIMATMDVLSQGYPFLEAVHSFLSWGDELVVVDGSSDGTWRILERLAANPRVRVHRIPWSYEGRRGEAIGSAYRAALELARARMGGRGWIVEVQANEVFHEGSYEILRELPRIHRGKVEFLLPYYSLHGTYLVEVLWRLRYMHASREIAIYSDAAALNSRERLGPSRLLRILARELWKSYVRPTDPYQRFFWYAEEGAEPAPIVPVFRYRVLLPADALE